MFSRKPRGGGLLKLKILVPPLQDIQLPPVNPHLSAAEESLIHLGPYI